MSYYLLIPVGSIALLYGIRKLIEYKWGWVRNTYSLSGRVFIITGANVGLGYETTRALVKRGATVILACRNVDRANEAIAAIRRETSAGLMVALELDLASFDSVKSFASKIKLQFPKFDCIICNAGLAIKNHQMTKDNYEMHFGVNHLSHFYLVRLLMDNIRQNNSRIVVVSSSLHQRGEVDLANLGKYIESPGFKNPNYNNSKLMNFYFARELYKKGHDSHVLCPGLCKTSFFRDYSLKWYHYIFFLPVAWLFLRSAEQGAQNVIFCATDNVNTAKNNPFTGFFIKDLKQHKSSINFDEEISERLWQKSEEICFSK